MTERLPGVLLSHTVRKMVCAQDLGRE